MEYIGYLVIGFLGLIFIFDLVIIYVQRRRRRLWMGISQNSSFCQCYGGPRDGEIVKYKAPVMFFRSTFVSNSKKIVRYHQYDFDGKNKYIHKVSLQTVPFKVNI
jgi:hypothetical protein